MAHPNPEPEEEEAVPEPEPAWKAQIPAIMADAAARLAGVRSGLDSVPLHLAPMSVDDVANARNRITLARGTLWAVTDDFFFSVSLMKVVEILALHAVETYDLDLADRETGLQSALTRLARARKYAANASSAVGGCNSYLLTAFVLLDQPAIPDVDNFVDHQRQRAVTDFQFARLEAQDCATMIGIACMDMAGGN